MISSDLIDIRRTLLDSCDGTLAPNASLRAEILELSHRALESVPNTAFVILMPDGVLLGALELVLDFYEGRIVQVRRRKIDEWLAEAVYLEGLLTRDPKSNIRDWWIKRRSFELGESVGLLIRDRDDMDLQRTIMVKKGRSDPFLAIPGTLRAKLGAPNKTFAILHSSDDWFNMLREARIFFNKPLEVILTAPTLTSIQLNGLYMSNSLVRVSALNQYDALILLKARLLGALDRDCSISARNDLLELYWQNRSAQGTQTSARQALANFISLTKSELTIFRETKNPPGLNNLTIWALLRHLCQPNLWPLIPFGNVEALMTIIDVTLEPVETTLISSAYHFIPEWLSSELQRERGKGDVTHI